MKQKTNREKENEKIRGKLRYLERKVQEEEAEKEIKNYERDEVIEDRTDEGGTNRLDGFRSIRR